MNRSQKKLLLTFVLIRKTLVDAFMLRIFAVLCFYILLPLFSFCQDWTDEQLDKASTASEINILSEDEKAAIMYINLARMYPKDFVLIELDGLTDFPIKNPSYLNSLKKELNDMPAREPLYFDNKVYDYAKCFAKESGERGYVGHTRKKCAKSFYPECCSYGMKAGWDIALQWLIDDGVSNLGHRKNCLEKGFNKIGLSIQYHKKYQVCAVADFSG